MCLYVSSKKNRKKAKEDIICYKVLNTKHGDLLSIFEHFKWTLGVEETAEKATDIWGDKIRDGYFHTYDNYFNAVKESLFPGFEVFECIIPKGTYYYKGRHSDSFEGYASKKLIVVKQLEKKF